MQRPLYVLFFLFIFLSACSPAARSGSLEVSNATVVLPAVGGMADMSGMDADASLAGYLQIRNHSGGDDRLIGVTSDFAQAMLHETQMNGDVASMKEVMGIDIPAGDTIALQSGGYHIMLMQVKQPLKAGDHVSLTLQFEKAGDVTVDALVTNR